MAYKPGETVVASFTITDSTGALANADATPTVTERVAGVATAAAITLSNPGPGRYVASWANTGTAGQKLEMDVAATVGGVATGDTIDLGVLVGKRVSDIVDASNRIVGIQGIKNTLDSLNDLAAADILLTPANKLQTDAAGSAYAIDSSGVALATATAVANVLNAVNNLNNLSALANLYGVTAMEIPDTGTIEYPFTLTIKDEQGHLIDLDANPALTVVDATGASHAANLSAILHPSTGVYSFVYSVAAGALDMGLSLTASGAVGGSARRADWGFAVVNADTVTQINAIQTAVAALPNAAGIAAAVRDVNNTSPALNSLGAAVQDADGKLTAVESSIAALPDAASIAKGVRDVNNTAPAANSLGAAVQDTDGKLITLTELDSLGNLRYTALALEQAPAGGGGGALTSQQSDELTAIYDRTSGGVSVTVSAGAHIAGDQSTLVLIQGEAYLAAINNAIELTVTDSRFYQAMLTDGTAATLRLAPVAGAGSSCALAGTLKSFDATAGSIVFSIDMTAAQSAQLQPGTEANLYELDLALAGDATQIIMPIVDGLCSVHSQIGV